MPHSILLASGSPRRRELIADLGMPFVCVSPDVDESVAPGMTPYRAAMLVAGRKGRAAAALPESAGRIVVSADTIVVLDGEIFGKPSDETDARNMLRRLSGRVHEVMTGVYIAAPNGRSAEFCERTAVRFRELTDGEIAAYAATGEPLDKAGAYGIQGRGKLLIEGIVGDYFNVMGLPVCRLNQMITELLGDGGAEHIIDLCNYDAALPRLTRTAGRVIIRDSEGRLLAVRYINEGYYKLPGGGVEEGESPCEAAVREAREEAGLALSPDALTPFCSVRERRACRSGSAVFDHTTYCFASALGESADSIDLTACRTEEGTVLEWIAPEELCAVSEGLTDDLPMLLREAWTARRSME